MTAASYSDALSSAYGRKTPESVISAVKQVIINQIESLDDQVQIKTTEFFNHTFAPDFVLSWKRESASRELYVRMNSTDPDFGEDLSFITTKSPVVFSLEPARGSRMHVVQSGERQLLRSNTLVTDAVGMTQISERKSSSKVLEVASPSLLQGGRGLLDGDRSESIADTIVNGFGAANSLEVDGTRSAVQIIDRYFRSTQSRRLTQFLKAIWVGAGGSQSQFPGVASVDTGLSVDALSFLLELQQDRSIDFWRRVGGDLTVEKLLSIVGAPSVNFDALINSNLDRIQGRACRVIEDASTQIDGHRGAWAQSGTSLTWRGKGVKASFADSKRLLPDVVDQDDDDADRVHRGLTLEDVLRRAQLATISLESLEIETASSRTMQYGSTENARRADVSGDEELKLLAATLGARATVRKAVAALPSAKAMICDFEESVASGRSSAKFAFIDFMTYGLSLLARLPKDDVEEIGRLSKEVNEAAGPLSLF